MSRKSLLALVAAAVIAALLAVVGQQSSRSNAVGGERVGTLFLPGLGNDLNAVDQVSIQRAIGQSAVTLRRTDTGWVVDQQDGYPADVAKLRTALIALSEAKVLEEKTSNPDFYSRLGVESLDAESATGIGITISGANVSFPMFVLGSPSGDSSRYARRADEATSLLIDADPDIPSEASQWLVPEIVDIRSERVQRIEILHADGERTVISKASATDTNFSVEAIPEGRELQYPTVANVVGNALRELGLDQAARAGVEDPEPGVSSEFWTFDGLVITASGRLFDDEPWVSIAARFESGQALDYATSTVDGSVAEETPVGDADILAEVDAINSRVLAWRFRIPSHIYDQMTRRMEDLLRAPDSDTQ
jgi:hypothetical protein